VFVAPDKDALHRRRGRCSILRGLDLSGSLLLCPPAQRTRTHTISLIQIQEKTRTSLDSIYREAKRTRTIAKVTGLDSRQRLFCAVAHLSDIQLYSRSDSRRQMLTLCLVRGRNVTGLRYGQSAWARGDNVSDLYLDCLSALTRSDYTVLR